MIRPKLLLIPLALPLLVPQDAMAQVTRILSLRNLRQSVEATYRLKANQGELASATQQGLQEDYHIAVDYSVYRARLLHGEVGLDLRADQNLYTGSDRSTSDTHGFGLLYDINGVFLDRLPYPVTFNYSSDIAEIPREYSSSYQQKTDNFAVHLPIAARYFPVSFSYNRNSTETSGLELDSRSESESYTFGASHHYKKSEAYFTIVGTTLDLDTENGEDAQHSSNIDANLNHSLDLGTKELNRMLYTRGHVVTQRGVNESRTTDLGTSLNWDLGKALDSGTDYSFSLREEPQQDSKNHNARIWLQHQLFKSLTTRVDVEGSDRTLSAGTEQSAGGGVNLSYHKLLKAGNRMQLTAGKRYSVTANKLEDGNIGVFAEAQTVGALLVVTLNQLNVAPGSVKVWNEARTRLFDEGIDYEVRESGAGTEVAVRVGTSRILVGDRLSIDYQVLVNSNITYSTTSMALGGDLSLNNGKHHLFTNWNSTQQGLISGRADQVNLAETNSYRAGFETKLEESGTVSLEYNRLSSSAENSQSLKGAFTRSGSWRQGRYTFTTTDRYIVRENKLVSRPGNGNDSANVFTAGGSYSTTVEKATVTATANFLNNMGFIDSSNLALGLDVRWSMRRLTVNAVSQANFRYSSGGWTSDQNLMVRLSRHF